uniref:Uncharacterized protein n=1 Tax=Pundamilia nyererei TaxID=303518 RepID=A0A3B4ES87_9CICH
MLFINGHDSLHVNSQGTDLIVHSFGASFSHCANVLNTKPFHYIYFNSIFRILHNCPVKQIQHHPVKKRLQKLQGRQPCCQYFYSKFYRVFLTVFIKSFTLQRGT